MTKILVSILSTASGFGNSFMQLHIETNALKFFKYFRLNVGKS